MAFMSDINVIEEKPELFMGPGAQLRQAREGQGLTLEDVANKLFLSRQRLIEIENDDYSRIDSFIYIKGYLRSYAKLAGLGEDDILNSFNKMGLQEENMRANTDVILQPRGKQKIKKRRRGIHWIDIIAVMVVILLAGLWWLSRSVDHNKPVVPKQVVQQIIVPK